MNERKADKYVKHNIWMRGQVTRIARAMVAIVQDREPELLSKITEDVFRGPRKLNAVIKAVFAEIDAMFAELDENLKAELDAVAGYQSTWMMGTIAGEAAVAVDAAAVMSLVLSDPFSGSLLKEHFERENRLYKEKLREGIRLGVANARSVKEIVASIGSEGSDVIGKRRRGLEMVVRTATNHTFSKADEYTYRKVGVERYQFVAILDNRTTSPCRHADGKIYEVGAPGSKVPPLHIGCRSFTIPIQDDNDIITENYEDWLKRQSEKDQIEILGPARYKLWKNGADLGSFVDQNNHVIPLSKLAA